MNRKLPQIYAWMRPDSCLEETNEASVWEKDKDARTTRTKLFSLNFSLPPPHIFGSYSQMWKNTFMHRISYI